MKGQNKMEKRDLACSVLENSAVEKAEKNEKGASLVEYVLLLALIAIICILAIRFLGTQASAQFSNIAGQI